MMKKSWLKSSMVQFLLFLMGGGLISMGLKFELIWDFAHYHYYNPWALLNGRFNYDLLAAGYNGFFNPVMDVPLYLLIKYFNNYPNFIYFVQGWWLGVMAFVLYKITALFFEDEDKNKGYAFFLTLLIGLSGYGVFFQIGSSSNEIMICNLLLWSLYLLLKMIVGKTIASTKIFFFAGIIAGAAMGLKLTAVIYCVALGVSLIVFYKKIPNPLKNISLFACGGLLGFLLFGGYWLWQCWLHFQNPLFPFANEIFNSPYWPQSNYTDNRFVPENWWKVIALPFDIRRGEGFGVMVDFRLAALYLAAFVWLINFGIKRFYGEVIKYNLALIFLLSFVIIAYLQWIEFFAIARYMIPIEVLSAVIIIKTAFVFLPESGWKKEVYIQGFGALLILLLLNPLFSENLGCRNCQLDNRQFHQFVEVKDVKIPDNSLILIYRIPHNFPVAAMLPYWAKTAKNIRAIEATPRNFETGFFSGGLWKQERDNIFQNHIGPKIGLLAVENLQQVKTLQKEEPLLKDMICNEVQANFKMTYYRYFLCAGPQISQKIWNKD